MAVIDITNSQIFTVEDGSLGYKFNPEMSVRVNTALFDTPINKDDVVIYRKNPNTIIYKGIVRRVRRSLSNESALLTVFAAESVLEGRSWNPVHTAYNKEILCRQHLLNATIQDAIDAEFVGDVATWFSSIEVPPSVGSLKCAPTETYQVSFLSFIDSIIGTHPHVTWCIEYHPSSTDVLPIGKLVLIDTKIGRTPRVLTVGVNCSNLEIDEDASTCASDIRVYGGGDFVELDEVLTPAWRVEDEVIPKTLTATAPDANDFSVSVLCTYLPWGYDLTSIPTITVILDGVPQTLWYAREFNFDAKTGTIYWYQTLTWINKTTGATSAVDPMDPAWRLIAGRHPDFFGATLTISFVYAGPDCYRLYSVTEPIANLRLRLAKVTDPDNPGDVIDQPVEQDTVIEAFKPSHTTDITDYVSQPLLYQVAKVFIPEETDITWSDRDPDVQPPKGFGIPLGSPEFEPGRRCVRFEDRQLSFIKYAFAPLDPIPVTQWITWQIKVRYTAWRNLLESRTGVAGTEYTARFVFDDLRKYTKFDGEVLVNDSAELVEKADDVEDYHGSLSWNGSATLPAPMAVVVVGPDTYKVSTLDIAIGDKVTLAGSVDPALAAEFSGIVASIDLAGLDSGVANIQFGTVAPPRNPFEPKDPVFVDYGMRSSEVLDISALQRRTY